MPLGWECKAKLIKQLPPKPSERKGTISVETQAPGPDKYTTPQIFGKCIIILNIVTIQ